MLLELEGSGNLHPMSQGKERTCFTPDYHCNGTDFCERRATSLEHLLSSQLWPLSFTCSHLPCHYSLSTSLSKWNSERKYFWQPACSAGMFGLVQYLLLSLFGGYNIINPALTWPPFSSVTQTLQWDLDTLRWSSFRRIKAAVFNSHCFSSPAANPPIPHAVRDNFRYKNLTRSCRFD